MNRLLNIIVTIILWGCSHSATKNIPQKDQNLQPDWLQEKPDQSVYYIGIGHSQKSDQNYLQEAKKRALEDLVSEIKVTISSTSVLSQLDAGKEFKEKYEQIIQTIVADEIEEFQQVDTWQDDRDYWVYYRLSKQRYREIKEEQKRNAISLSLDMFTKAKQAERNSEEVL